MSDWSAAFYLIEDLTFQCCFLCQYNVNEKPLKLETDASFGQQSSVEMDLKVPEFQWKTNQTESENCFSSTNENWKPVEHYELEHNAEMIKG